MIEYRITDIEKIILNGRKVKLFKYYVKCGDVFIFCGNFTAPLKTSDFNLYRYVELP
jgi:hypothetical protein